MSQFWPPVPRSLVLTGEVVSSGSGGVVVVFDHPFAAAPLILVSSTRVGSTDTSPRVVEISTTQMTIGAQNNAGSWTAGARLMWRAEGQPA